MKIKVWDSIKRDYICLIEVDSIENINFDIRIIDEDTMLENFYLCQYVREDSENVPVYVNDIIQIDHPVFGPWKTSVMQDPYGLIFIDNHPLEKNHRIFINRVRYLRVLKIGNIFEDSHLLKDKSFQRN